MICIAGWLGIASTRPEYDRVYALVFGLGLGLVGDETGLLLTLGDYHSELTYVVLLVGISTTAMGYLVYRYEPYIKTEVFLLGRGERLVHLGIGIMAVSSLAFAFEDLPIGAAALAVGVALLVTGTRLHRSRDYR
jgi:hypothetical protein